uniref:Uncharacterized protein n=1 Tax=Acanthochromis polyacanthus TaxID=80966 RepID=A0A3Q1HV95_9TELE
MELRVCRYRSWRAEGASAITTEASLRALEAFISPSAIFLTLALASRLASASAAMARCICCGSFTSLISTRSTLMPHGSVASLCDFSVHMLCCCKLILSNK